MNVSVSENKGEKVTEMSEQDCKYPDFTLKLLKRAWQKRNLNGTNRM